MGSEGEAKYTLVTSYHCNVCRKDYGLTNLSYEGLQIWVGCDCQPKNAIYKLNTANMRDENKEVKDGE